jgi:RNA polymerase sigma-70 factor (ECF subfamily)
MDEGKEINEVVIELQNGSQKALETIYDRYSASLYGLILKIIRDEALASDVLQDCFIKIWKKAPTFDVTKGSIFTWMLNICRNKAIDELRKRQRQREGFDKMTNESPNENGYENNINVIGLDFIVDELPENQKLIIEYLYFRGYTQQEVSDELDIPLGTVKTRARNAINQLKESFILFLIFWILKNT